MRRLGCTACTLLWCYPLAVSVDKHNSDRLHRLHIINDVIWHWGKHIPLRFLAFGIFLDLLLEQSVVHMVKSVKRIYKDGSCYCCFWNPSSMCCARFRSWLLLSFQVVTSLLTDDGWCIVWGEPENQTFKWLILYITGKLGWSSLHMDIFQVLEKQWMNEWLTQSNNRVI